MRVYRYSRSVGSYRVLFEAYTRPTPPINRFATLLACSILGRRRIRFKKYFRWGASLLIDRYGCVHASCIIYVYGGGYAGLCVGSPEHILLLARAMNIYTLFVPASISLPSEAIVGEPVVRHGVALVFLKHA
jgi:hypothetical protein